MPDALDILAADIRGCPQTPAEVASLDADVVTWSDSLERVGVDLDAVAARTVLGVVQALLPLVVAWASVENSEEAVETLASLAEVSAYVMDRGPLTPITKLPSAY